MKSSKMFENPLKLFLGYDIMFRHLSSVIFGAAYELRFFIHAARMSENLGGF